MCKSTYTSSVEGFCNFGGTFQKTAIFYLDFGYKLWKISSNPGLPHSQSLAAV